MPSETKAKLLVGSNLFFLIPGIFALVNKAYVYTLVIFVATLCSIVFHLKQSSRPWRFADHVTASVLIISNLILFYITSFTTAYFLAAVLFAVIALIFYFRTTRENYYFNHTLWHILSSIVSLVSVLGYIRA